MDYNLEIEVRMAKEGNKAAFIKLVAAQEVRMYNVARSIVRRDEDAADAMQETVLKAFRSIGTLKHPAYFNSWLIRILINECNTILRKRTRVITMAEPPDANKASMNYEHMELREAIYQLEETSRTIVILHYFQDMSLRQIADTLDMSEGAVKTRLHRARRSLSDWLSEPAERKVHG